MLEERLLKKGCFFMVATESRFSVYREMDYRCLSCIIGPDVVGPLDFRNGFGQKASLGSKGHCQTVK